MSMVLVADPLLTKCPVTLSLSMLVSDFFAIFAIPCLLLLLLADKASARSCSYELAAQNPPCPPEMQNVLQETEVVAKEIIQQTMDALTTNDELTQSAFQYYMGHACDLVQVQAVLQQMLDWNYGFYCSNGGGGKLFSVHCGVLLGKTAQVPERFNANGARSCADSSGGPANQVYRIIHEFSHSAQFNWPDGSQHFVNDGQDMPISTPRQPGKKGRPGTCYDVDCLSINAARNEQCFNGYVAQAYKYLTWAIHCKKGAGSTSATDTVGGASSRRPINGGPNRRPVEGAQER